MKATITEDYLNSDQEEIGRQFIYGNDPKTVAASDVMTRKFEAYDDDNEKYYALDAEISDDIDLGDLLAMLGSYAGVTALVDVTGDGEDWSAS